MKVLFYECLLYMYNIGLYYAFLFVFFLPGAVKIIYLILSMDLKVLYN